MEYTAVPVSRQVELPPAIKNAAVDVVACVNTPRFWGAWLRLRRLERARLGQARAPRPRACSAARRARRRAAVRRAPAEPEPDGSDGEPNRARPPAAPSGAVFIFGARGVAVAR